MAPPPQVLVVGAGATGASVVRQLRKAMGRDVRIQVWEKARGPGGRMSTNRQELDGISVRADMGAQYLSLDGGDKLSAEVADALKAVCAEAPPGCLCATPERPSGSGWRHLAGLAGGVNDALKKLLEDSGAETHFEKRVASLDEQQGRWRVRPFDGAPAFFDAVVLAVPGCGVGGDNLNKIHGGWEGRITTEQNKQLLAAQHDARWSFAFFLPLDCAAQLDEFFGPSAFEMLVDDGTLHMLCYQSRKSSKIGGVAPEGGLAVVAHSTLEWARRNARAGGRDERLLKEVAERVKGVLKLQGRLSELVLASKVITWKQCEVTKPLPPGPDGPCMVVSSSPPLVLAGDYFTQSTFTGCITSAAAAAEATAGLLAGRAVPATGRSNTQADEDFAFHNQSDGYWERTKESKGKGKGHRTKGYSKGKKERDIYWDDLEEDWKRPHGGKGKSKGAKKGYSWKPYSGG